MTYMLTAEEIAKFVRTCQTLSTVAKWGCSIIGATSGAALAATLSLSRCDLTTNSHVDVDCFADGMQQNALFTVFVGSAVLSLATMPWIYVAQRTLPPADKTAEFSETTAAFVRNIAMLAFMHQMTCDNSEKEDERTDTTNRSDSSAQDASKTKTT